MKKSLIALAVLAASGAAFAQSSVTLFGRLDASVAQVKTEKTGAVPAASLSQTGVNESNLNSTFWGMRGTEDLGGGLKANFMLQSRFAMDTGVGSTGGIFDREAWVGLSGSFGAVNLGRIPTAYDDLHGATNNVFNSNFATTTDVAGGVGIAKYTGTLSNSIKYVSPSMGGFTAALQYSFGENKLKSDGLSTGTNLAVDNSVGNATDSVSMHVRYAAGPLLVGFAHQSEKQAQASLAAAQDKFKYNLLAASYDFGVAKLVGGYTKTDSNTRDDKAFQLGVSVPMGAFNLAAGFVKEDSERAGFADVDGKGFSLVGTYDLSKRTTLYAGVENTKTEASTGASSANITTSKRTNFATGVRHTF
jgi:predicted porin